MNYWDFEIKKKYDLPFPDILDVSELEYKAQNNEKVTFSLEDKKLVVTVIPPKSEIKDKGTGRIDISGPGIPPVSFIYLIQK